MCQFKTVLASWASNSACGRCDACCCQAAIIAAAGAASKVSTPDAAESSAEDVLRQLPTELEEQLFQAAASSLPPADFSQEETASAVEKGRESAKQAVHSQQDSNNNDITIVGILKSVKSLACQRRRVQFADELGHSLIEVRLFESPNSHYVPCEPTPLDLGLDLLLQCHFEQPSTQRALHTLLSSDECNVQLCSLRLDPADAGVSLTGYALVKNLSFEKRVFVRITTDSWRSFADLEADYAGSLDDSRDVFEFELRCEVEEVDFEFCVCFETEARGRHWDSNGGANYRASLVKSRRATFSLWDDGED